MNELLKKLLEAEVLTEETRSELEAAFNTQLDEAMVAARAEATATVTAELREQWITERETLIEALDSKVTEALTAEIEELREGLESFRDLEAEFAEKIVEAKADMATVLKGDMAKLVENIDSFLEVRLSSELTELAADIAEVKKNEFGKKVFESFVAEFKKHYAGDDSVEAKLTESEQRLEEALAALQEAEKRAAKMERSIKLEQVLSPISGKTREVMEAILKTTPTAMLEEAYNTYIGRVLKESAEPTAAKASEKEEKVLAEDEKTEKVTGVVKTGDDATRVDESKSLEAEVKVTSTLSESAVAQLRRAAGLI